MNQSRKPPGLPSLQQSKEDRARGKYSRGSPGVWLSIAASLITIVVVYRYVEARQLGGAKESLLSKERAVKASVGAAWFPLRDGIEQRVLEAAALPTNSGDHVDPSVNAWDFKSSPGLYLRLRLAEAKDVMSLRHAAASSQRDGFVGCFLREPNPAAAKGEPDAGAFAEQPWNWQKAYAATRILTDEWTEDVGSSDDPLRLRVFEEQYEKAMKTEIPSAIDLVKRAQFFLLVLDEDSPDAQPKAKAGAEAGAQVTLADLQRVPHYARVHLINLQTHTEVVRIRRAAEASFIFAGESRVTDPETLDAMQRQVNNCALAKEVDKAIKEAGPK